jgi:hypothetical protein
LSLLFIIGVLFQPYSSKAQQSNKFYFTAGYTYNYLYVGNQFPGALGAPSEMDYTNYKDRHGIFMGLGFDVPLGNCVHIVTGINFGNYRSKFDISGGGKVYESGPGPGYYWFYSGVGKINYWSLQLPLTLRFYFANEYFIGGGPLLNIVLVNNSIVDYMTSYYSDSSLSLTSKESINDVVELTEATLGLCAQAGKKFKLKNFDLGIQLDINATLGPIFYTDDYGLASINTRFYSLSFDVYPHFKKAIETKPGN